MRADAVFVSYGLLSSEPFAINSNHPRIERFHIRDSFEGLTTHQWQAWFAEIWSRLGTSILPDAKPFSLAAWREALAYFRASGRQAKPLLMLN